jgi:hypothetical protein
MATFHELELKKRIDRAAEVIRSLQKLQPPGASPVSGSQADQVASAIALLEAVLSELRDVEPFLHCVRLTPEQREWALQDINEQEIVANLEDARRKSGPTLPQLIDEFERESKV